ncbi:hypothetical protein GGP89_000003 [Salinibacter ruber]|uniref:Uncharacterized protein n=1 Tax=Salinibacter ruber TaxID=146919 RepID=A0A9X2R9A9_9BACT|nr:hypothetical protein [Salinibacter ruber]MCS3863471.1 hypothetical protein [Salinibacter ruber]MCS4150368.1 hypothetical protein [Salinibacter ruber]MCS4195896.1 hypothetical protein [Salinibacter ruber]
MAVRVVPTAFVKDLPPLHWIFPAYAKKGRPLGSSQFGLRGGHFEPVPDGIV